MRVFLGIDNGVSGSIGVLIPEADSRADFIRMPTFSQQNYTKTKRNVTRIDHRRLNTILCRLGAKEPEEFSFHIMLERPMVNPGRFQATASALRALEATLVVLERYRLPVQYVDSKEWQKVLLPSGLKGPKELKKASADIGKRLFPQLSKQIDHQKDADGLLIAEFCRRTFR